MHSITPQLPRPFPVPENLKGQLTTGAYKLSFEPNELYIEGRSLAGTLRLVTHKNGTASASADFYFASKKEQKEKDGIPVFDAENYRGYGRVIGIEETTQKDGNGSMTFVAAIEYHLFEQSNRSWKPLGLLHANLTCDKTRSELKGEVKMEKESLGTLSWTLNRLRDNFVREGKVVIRRAENCDLPGGKNKGESEKEWQEMFKDVLWNMSVEEKKIDKNFPMWQENDLRTELDAIVRNDPQSLTVPWTYHLLCVPEIEGGNLGLMFDPGANDSRDIPREGAAISARVKVELEGKNKGLYQQFKDLYFRTAVHEIGHAMGLRHGDDGIMAETDNNVAANVNNFSRFSEGDKIRLIHLPDICVRPGGIPFGFEYTTSRIGFHETTYRSRGFSLKVSPLHSIVPLGAPVRLEIQMVADAGYGLPRDIRLGSGFVRGEVIDPKGVPRTFASIKSCSEKNCALNSSGCTDPGWSAKEDANQRLSGLTLLRGPEGFLFAESGQYRIRVFVEWRDEGKLQSASAETDIFIKAIDLADEKHASLVTEVLRTPDLLYAIALPGTPHELVDRLIDDEELGPHYRYNAARSKFQEDYDKAIAILNKDAVLTERESHHVLRLIEEEYKERKEMDQRTKSLLDSLKKVGKESTFTIKARIEKLFEEKPIASGDTDK